MRALGAQMPRLRRYFGDPAGLVNIAAQFRASTAAIEVSVALGGLSRGVWPQIVDPFVTGGGVQSDVTRGVVETGARSLSRGARSRDERLSSS